MLDTLFSRYIISDISVTGFEQTVFYLFGYQDDFQHLPLASVVAQNTSHAGSKKYWFLAEPVHLKADRDRLLLFRHSSMNITDVEAQSMCQQISDYFLPDSMVCYPTSDPMCWLFGLNEELEVLTHWLNDVIGRPIDAYLATGNDARRWRQLMNEMQMLLHQSDVNQQRMHTDLPEINGVWLSAYGELPQKECFHSLPEIIYSDNNITNSLANLTEVKVVLGSEDISVEGTVLAVYTKLQEAVTADQKNDWLSQLEPCALWLQQQVEQAQSQQQRIFIYPANGKKIELLSKRLWHRFTNKDNYRNVLAV